MIINFVFYIYVLVITWVGLGTRCVKDDVILMKQRSEARRCASLLI